MRLNLLFRYAFKMFIRSKRAIVFLIVITLSFTTIVTFDGIVLNTVETYRSIYEYFKYGDLVVIATNRMFDAKFINALNASIRNIRAITPFLSFTTSINVHEHVYEAIIYGTLTDPDVDTIPGIDWTLLEKGGVVIDKGLAHALGKHEGDTIELFGRTFRIVKVMNLLWAPNLDVNFIATIVMHYNILSRILNVSGKYNELRVSLRNKTRILDTVYDILKFSANNGYEVQIDLRISGVKSFLASFSFFTDTINLTVLVAIMIFVSLFILTDVQKNSRSLILLESIGMTRTNITMLYAIQAVLMLITGSLLALLIGNCISYLIVINTVKTLLDGIPMIFRISIPLDKMIATLVVSSLVALISSAITIRKTHFEGTTYSIRITSKHNKALVRMSSRKALVLRKITLRKLWSIAIIALMAL